MSEQNREYVDSQSSYANDTSVQFAMRELQANLGNSKFWVGFASVVLVLAVMGPFKTSEVLSFSERLVFWSLMGISTYVCGSAFSIMFNAATYNLITNDWARQIFAGLLSGVPISLLVWFINVKIFQFDLGGWPEFLNLSSIILVISTAIAILYKLIANPGESNAIDNTNESTSPFLKRLPVELGKNLLHISSEDHYVRAITDRGSHMILMRFSDAIVELESMPGFQIHRSHWVAEKAARKVIRENGKKMLQTVDGCKFPISRSFAKEVTDRLATL